MHSILCTLLPFQDYLVLWFARSVCAADVKRGGNWIRSSMVLACIAPLCMRLAVHSQLIQLYSISKRFSSVLGAVTCLHMLWRSAWPILSFSINVAVTGYGQVTNELAFSERWISIHYTCATTITKWKAWLPAIAYLKCLIPPLKNLFTWIRDN